MIISCLDTPFISFIPYPHSGCVEHHQFIGDLPPVQWASGQAGAELGQAQLKLGFCRFVGFSEFSFYFIGLIEKIWFGVFGLLHFKHFAG